MKRVVCPMRERSTTTVGASEFTPCKQQADSRMISSLVSSTDVIIDIVFNGLFGYGAHSLEDESVLIVWRKRKRGRQVRVVQGE